MGLDQIPDSSEQRSRQAFITHDGGQSWEQMANPCDAPVNGEGPYGGFISMVTPTEAWAVCSGYCCAGFIYQDFSHTLDGGLSWQRVPEEGGCDRGLCTNDFVRDFSFNESGEGSLTTYGSGGLVRTTDSGLDWQYVRVKIDGHREGLLPSSTQELDTGETIVSTSGSFHLSADDGETWERLFEFE